MNNNEEKSVLVNFLAGIGVGALIGAAAALLLAPKSGNETRQDIKTATDDLRVKADKVISDLSESGEELVKKSREILESTRDKVQHAINAGKEAVAKKCNDDAPEAKNTEA
jgi:gas vesicle protein